MDEDNRPLILALNHNQRNLELLITHLGMHGYRTVTTHMLDEYVALLEEYETIHAALVDITGFDARIWQCCQQLQLRNIPFVVISHQQSSALFQTCLHHGARNLMVKPLVLKELLKVLQSLL